jgi:hypothetical protein
LGLMYKDMKWLDLVDMVRKRVDEDRQTRGVGERPVRKALEAHIKDAEMSKQVLTEKQRDVQEDEVIEID